MYLPTSLFVSQEHDTAEKVLSHSVFVKSSPPVLADGAGIWNLAMQAQPKEPAIDNIDLDTHSSLLILGGFSMKTV